MAITISEFKLTLDESGKSAKGSFKTNEAVAKPAETLSFVFRNEELDDEIPAIATVTPNKNKSNKEFTCTLSANEDITGYSVRVLGKDVTTATFSVDVVAPKLPKPAEIKTERKDYDTTKKIKVSWKVENAHNDAQFNFKLVSNQGEINLKTPGALNASNPTDGNYSLELEFDTLLDAKELKNYLVQIQAVKGNDTSLWGTELNMYYLFRAEVNLFDNLIPLTVESGQTKYGLESPVRITYTQFQKGLKESFKYDLPNEIAGRDLTGIELSINELDMDTATKEFNVAVVAKLDFDILPGILKVERIGLAVRRMDKTTQERKAEQQKLKAINQRAALKLLSAPKEPEVVE